MIEQPPGDAGAMLIDSPLQIVPDYSHERAMQARGARFVAGVDEAGRGPLAGPVVVSAVVLDPDRIPDGLNDSKKLSEEQREALFALIGGDGRSVSIAAASIVAKVTRDRMCAIMDCDAPDFGFAGHKGYGTPQHLRALTAHGPCRHHRAEFAPVAEARLRLTVAN